MSGKCSGEISVWEVFGDFCGEILISHLEGSSFAWESSNICLYELPNA